MRVGKRLLSLHFVCKMWLFFMILLVMDVCVCVWGGGGTRGGHGCVCVGGGGPVSWFCVWVFG